MQIPALLDNHRRELANRIGSRTDRQLTPAELGLISSREGSFRLLDEP